MLGDMWAHPFESGIVIGAGLAFVGWLVWLAYVLLLEHHVYNWRTKRYHRRSGQI